MIVLASGATRTWPNHKGRLGIGQLVSPRAGNAIWASSWAVDNDSFNKAGFDQHAFRALVGRLAPVPGCLFVAAPDVVGDPFGTIGLFEWWLPFFYDREHPVPVALVGQDGFEDRDVDYWLGLADAWFVGGSTEWKLSAAAADLTREAKGRGKWCHLGRVNTRRRFFLAHEQGYDSIDGTGWSMFPSTYAAKGERWAAEAAQPRLF